MECEESERFCLDHILQGETGRNEYYTFSVPHDFLIDERQNRYSKLLREKTTLNHT